MQRPAAHPDIFMPGHIFNRGAADGEDPFPAESQLPELTDPETTRLAITQLRAPSALMLLSEEEAAVVVGYMRQIDFADGDVFMREGDTENADFVLLVLDGEVTVESIVVSRTTPSTLNVLGPGSLIGELGLIDGGPRSATCTAGSDLRCVLLTRSGLTRLIDDHPRTGAKLLLAVALYMAKRLRDGAQKLKLYARLAQVMQEEINKLMGTG
jgi:CRP/FNR family cyclic AMP-dependent transcriptional regulator